MINMTAMSDTDKLNLLNRYLGGEAKASIKGYLMLPPTEAYERAYKLLLYRYGDRVKLGNTFRDQLRRWAKISGTDADGLRRFVDFLVQCETAKSSLKTLRILDDESENTDMARKLPVWLSRKWSRRVAAYREENEDYPSFSEFVSFLIKEERFASDPLTRALQKTETSKSTVRGSSFAAESRGVSDAGRRFGACFFCKNRHFITVCDQFRAKSFEFRQNYVKENRMCFGCLNKGHQVRECKNKNTCEICQGRHPTVMHMHEATSEGAPTTISVTTCASNRYPERLDHKSSLIVPVRISHPDCPGREVVTYAMLDTQSDASFITEGTARELGVEGRETRLSLSTMTSNERIIRCTRFAGLQVRGFNSQCMVNLPSVFSRKSIPINRDHIPCPDTVNGWPYLETLRSQLMPKIDCEIGLLIGYDCPKALIPKNVISAPNDGDGPFGYETVFGWGVVGVVGRPHGPNPDSLNFSHRILARPVTGSEIISPRRTKEVVSPADCLRALEGDFIDKGQDEETISSADRAFLKIMEDGIKVDASQHYSMPLPFNNQKGRLFNNRVFVSNRTLSLQRKLDKSTSYKEEYTRFMDEMIEKGFAEEVSEPVGGAGEFGWYVPHFGVFHKTKHKLRVVFDCSARYNGISLNDALYKGPDFINPLVGILCRFRKHPVAFSCDVEKMFYCFHVHPEDRDYLRFLWWKGGDTSRPLSTFRMTAHLFGAVSSPACATFGLRHIAREFTDYGDDVLDFISNNFYVDDGLKSVWGEDAAISLVERTVALCKTRGVRLHKFVSNSENLLKTLPDSECAVKSNVLSLDLEECPTERVLGVLWDIKSDSFKFKVIANKEPKTRREMLSVTSSIFDPLGWIAPFTLKARLILQQMCRGGSLDWDEEVSQPILNSWTNWYQETTSLHELSINRCWQKEDYKELQAIQLHHFSDACEDGYGACSYLRTVDQAGRVSVCLVMAKARVAPSVSITIPRLELMAAVVAARLSTILERELRLERVSHHFWTDSQIVLGYLKNDSKRFKVFVANRVQQIHDASKPSQWSHVTGVDNPADLASRGMKAEDLVKSTLWFKGPSFLQQEWVDLNRTGLGIVDPNDHELRKVIVRAVETDTLLDVFNFSLFSSWRSLTRGVARAKLLARSFKANLSIKMRLRSATQKPALEPLSVTDLQTAEQLIIRAVQDSYFSEEISCLLSKETLDRGSELRRLNCFLDKAGILRVGGRLRFTNLYSAFKHPVILPKGAHVSNLLLQDCHQGVKHQGRGMTINEVRARGYWVIGLGTLVKGLIQKCVTCRALRGSTLGQKMADLPADRAECAPPFTYCGVDIFGPFLVKERRSEIKRYGAILTCLASRAIHIEMTYTLTTDSFIHSLRKFMAIRGPVRLLRCDNGTNFVGANKELSRSIEIIQSNELRNFVLTNNCDLEFCTNPPSASHMGGAWERLIRVVRSVLSAILDKYSARLDDNSLSTFLYEVAAIVNTRPLSLEHVTDPDHPEPLTPNHLLRGKSKVVMPPPGEFSQGDVYSIKRWRCVQFLADQFGQRWRREYLQYLQLRSKWLREEKEPRVGDIVLITDANIPRNEWRRGTVIEVFPSRDGLVRSVKLRTGRREDG